MPIEIFHFFNGGRKILAPANLKKKLIKFHLFDQIYNSGLSNTINFLARAKIMRFFFSFLLNEKDVLMLEKDVRN